MLWQLEPGEVAIGGAASKLFMLEGCAAPSNRYQKSFTIAEEEVVGVVEGKRWFG